MIDPTDRREAGLLALAHACGTTVHIAVLPPGSRGRYESCSQRILLRDGMTTAQRVSALAHEVVHARRGDSGPQGAATEQHVDEEAARLVITDRAYAAAEAVAGPDPRALAVELDVTPGLVEAWQRRQDRAPGR